MLHHNCFSLNFLYQLCGDYRVYCRLVALQVRSQAEKVTVYHSSCLFSQEENANDAQLLKTKFCNAWENLIQVQEEAEIRSSGKVSAVGGHKRPLLITINYRLCIMKKKKRKIIFLECPDLLLYLPCFQDLFNFHRLLVNKIWQY